MKHLHFFSVFHAFVKYAINIEVLCIFIQLVGRAIATAAREFHMESNSEEEFSLSISLVHVVYNRIEKRLGYFCKLVQAQPDIVPRLLQVIPADDSEMVWD